MNKIQLKKLRKDLIWVPNARKILAEEFGVTIKSLGNYLYDESKKAVHIRAAEMVAEFEEKHRQAEEYINSK